MTLWTFFPSDGLTVIFYCFSPWLSNFLFDVKTQGCWDKHPHHILCIYVYIQTLRAPAWQVTVKTKCQSPPFLEALSVFSQWFCDDFVLETVVSERCQCFPHLNLRDLNFRPEPVYRMHWSEGGAPWLPLSFSASRCHQLWSKVSCLQDNRAIPSLLLSSHQHSRVGETERSSAFNNPPEKFQSLWQKYLNEEWWRHQVLDALRVVMSIICQWPRENPWNPGAQGFKKTKSLVCYGPDSFEVGGMKGFLRHLRKSAQCGVWFARPRQI